MRSIMTARMSQPPVSIIMQPTLLILTTISTVIFINAEVRTFACPAMIFT